VPNIALDYEKILATNGRLNSAVENILPMLETLKNDVHNLLGDGLVFQASSPAIRESYETFNTSLVGAINGIKSFAEQFKEIKESMENMDTEMAGKIRAAGK